MKKQQKKLTSLSTRDYEKWIAELKRRFRATQIKAGVAVNSALIEFYWMLGKDVCERFAKEAGYGSTFYQKVSVDLRDGMPEGHGFSARNLRYCHDFYALYSSVTGGERILQQVVAKLACVPWGHHCQIIDKCKGDVSRAVFYVERTIQNGWSRNVLLNWLSSDLYEREGKAQSNFSLTMPGDDCDLARQMVKDPQVFEVFGLKEKYNETELKAAIVANIESTLLSLGHGVAFLGREYPIEIGGEAKAIDLLFYIIPLHRYLVMEVKTGKYEPADLGQLSGYMVMAEQVLNTLGDNPPVGVLVCKEHNRVLAKYHLEKLGVPMAITDYELKKILPTQAQLAKCYRDAEKQIAGAKQKGGVTAAAKNRKGI